MRLNMMKTHRSLSALLLVIGVGFATPACASQLYGYGGAPRGYEREAERRAYDNGYREGVQQGQNDVRRGRDYSYSRHNEYRDADDGYRRGTIDRDLYRRSFRSGFQTGYSESYNRYARINPRDNYPRGVPYPNQGGYGYPSSRDGYPSNRGVFRSPAADIGYRDGIEAGRNDARDRNRFDPVRAKRYREGDHDYNGRYGSRDEYKREYRAAFEQGYREGYGATRR
jgi:hypothetical protein